MIVNTVLNLIHQYGYLFFFLAFSLGPFGIPIPNEVTILTSAILSRSGFINHWVAYISILIGLLTAITVAYFTGKLFGHKFKHKFSHNKHYLIAESILRKRGHVAMCIGMFIPIVRYFMPLLIGLSGINYQKFAFITYSSALLWTITFFALGSFFGIPILSMLEDIK
ncbi:MAG TPA: DedA family protein [Paenibacillus sp.]|uniref:DedA family protein n=1 Tax=Paenibacillus TaxID=44249 RepID=UPI000B9FF8D9|nr:MULTISPECIES: VTT domain-containing protein [Paenibacillus]OZQ74229.1 DedA family protein [Paenibacillus taichungensis]HBU82637.1 DedA family protein [Paenibacillus sp.]